MPPVTPLHARTCLPAGSQTTTHNAVLSDVDAVESALRSKLGQTEALKVGQSGGSAGSAMSYGMDAALCMR